MSTSKEESNGERLKKERLRCGLSQKELADLIGVSKPTIHNWEHDDVVPQPLNQRELAKIFGKSIEELFLPQKDNEEDEILTAQEQQKERDSLIPLADLEMLLVETIGRESDIEAILKLIKTDGERLVTLKGVGGVGKTHLASEVEKELQKDGSFKVIYISLARISHGSEVLRTIADTLEVKNRDDLFESVVETLKKMTASRVLLIMDNLEHVLDDARRVIAKLLGKVPKLQCLVTSRRILDAEYEVVRSVKPLATPTFEEVYRISSDEDLLRYPATKLFRRYVLAKDSLYPLTKDCRTIASICIGLGGLPLAIRIAASFTTMRGANAVLEKVQNREIFKISNKATDVDRQHSLNDTFDWSYQLLGEQFGEKDQQFFRRFSVFAGGCSFEAAAWVCCEDNLTPDVLDIMRELMDCSMLEKERESGRLVMHPLVHEYAQSLLGASDEYQETKKRWRDFYLKLVEEHGNKYYYWYTYYDDPNDKYNNKIRMEIENILAAMQWSYEDSQGGEALLHFVGDLRWHWGWLAPSGWKEWMNKALYRPGLLDQQGRPTYAQEAYAKALFVKGDRLCDEDESWWNYGRDTTETQEALQKCIELYAMLEMEKSEYARSAVALLSYNKSLKDLPATRI